MSSVAPPVYQESLSAGPTGNLIKFRLSLSETENWTSRDNGVRIQSSRKFLLLGRSAATDLPYDLAVIGFSSLDPHIPFFGKT
jgi:hypothetical protein